MVMQRKMGQSRIIYITVKELLSIGNMHVFFIFLLKIYEKKSKVIIIKLNFK